MKNYVRILAVLVLLIALGAVFIYSYDYRQEKNASNIILTTADMNTKKSTTAPQRELIAENEEGDYQLYIDDDTVLLVHGELEKELDGWLSYVELETPTLYYYDYDGDDEGELIIKLVSGTTTDGDGNSSYAYTLYLFDTAEQDGETRFTVITANNETWKIPFEEAIKTEMSQLKSCNKFIQFVMDDAEESLYYDDETGISLNEYTGFACALQNSNGSYATLDRWSKGNGVYSVDDDGNITLEIQLLAYYEDVDDPQYIGIIHCGIGVSGGEFVILPSSIEFVADDEYKVISPASPSDEDWESTINNSADPIVRDGDDNQIDWLEASFDLSTDFEEKTISFAGYTSQIKSVDKVVITPDSVVLTAKDGYEFSSHMLNTGEFSVKIYADTDDEYNIAFSGEIKTVGGRSVLTITFDRAYDREMLDGMVVKFGA